MLDIVDKGPADASSRAGVYESILRTGVEGVLAVDKLGVEDYIPLLLP